MQGFVQCFLDQFLGLAVVLDIILGGHVIIAHTGTSGLTRKQATMGNIG